MFRIHEFRHTANLALLIYAGQNAAALGQDYAIAAASQLINMLDLSDRNRRTRCFQKELLVILHRPAKLDIQLGYDKEHTGRLKVFIRNTVSSQKLRPAHLEPYRVHAVMNHTALIRLGVTRQDIYRMARNFRSSWKVHKQIKLDIKYLLKLTIFESNATANRTMLIT